MAEQRTFNSVVLGSSPNTPTIYRQGNMTQVVLCTANSNKGGDLYNYNLRY